MLHFQLFILETIGTQELILIGVLALIIFGPRKLPEMAKKLGAMMSEFRKVSNEFKETWEREASLDDPAIKNSTPVPTVARENSIGSLPAPSGENDPSPDDAPAIREVSRDEFDIPAKDITHTAASLDPDPGPSAETAEEKSEEPQYEDKRSWL